MMMRNYDAGCTCLKAFFCVFYAQNALNDERHFCSLHKILEFFRCLRLHRKPEHIVKAALAVKRMVNVHAHGKTARLDGMFNFAENFVIVFVRLDNFDCPCFCGANLFKLFVAAHTDPMHRTGFLRGFCIDCHSVFCSAVKMRKRRRHNRCAESFAVKLNLCRRKHRIDVACFNQKRIKEVACNFVRIVSIFHNHFSQGYFICQLSRSESMILQRFRDFCHVCTGDSVLPCKIHSVA